MTNRSIAARQRHSLLQIMHALRLAVIYVSTSLLRLVHDRNGTLDDSANAVDLSRGHISDDDDDVSPAAERRSRTSHSPAPSGDV